jgi:poly(3-hydroxybutyrate) depolymerase
VGELKRTYLTYVPQGLAKGSPLVVVMHGSGESGAQMRIETGYGFERLADQRGFAVVYPNAYEGSMRVMVIPAVTRTANAAQRSDSENQTPAQSSSRSRPQKRESRPRNLIPI